MWETVHNDTDIDVILDHLELCWLSHIQYMTSTVVTTRPNKVEST